jgi:hypothetical protein
VDSTGQAKEEIFSEKEREHYGAEGCEGTNACALFPIELLSKRSRTKSRHPTEFPKTNVLEKKNSKLIFRASLISCFRDEDFCGAFWISPTVFRILNC